ncbi:MAG: hypothetical protein LH472_04555 [Pyrinomonadaceae bacterium]|nr:hypothetical protein [Pyrinomonadaceae bacterium]
MCLPNSVFAQRRDHLNEMEIELIRDEQSIERRMEIYIKAIDRRLMVLNNDSSNAKQVQKDLEKWGELPQGTRAQLLRDIEKILDETISKIDDVASRDLKNKLLPVAVNVLADGANRFVPELKTQFDKAADQKERGSILGAIDFCHQIIEGSVKVPKLTPKEQKKIQKEVQKEIEKSQQPN